MGSTEVYSDDWWLDRNDQNRCVAHRKNGERCLKPAIRGTTVCRNHGGSAPQVQRKAKERLELAADRMAKELLGLATGAESEAVKLNAIRDALDRAGLGVKSEVSVELKPYEQLFADLTGVANISRAEHHAHRRRPVLELPDAIDAEVLASADEGDPARPPGFAGDAMRDAGSDDVPGGDMPREPGLMTLEQAAEAERTHRYR